MDITSDNSEKLYKYLQGRYDYEHRNTQEEDKNDKIIWEEIKSRYEENINKINLERENKIKELEKEKFEKIQKLEEKKEKDETALKQQFITNINNVGNLFENQTINDKYETKKEKIKNEYVKNFEKIQNEYINKSTDIQIEYVNKEKTNEINYNNEQTNERLIIKEKEKEDIKIVILEKVKGKGLEEKNIIKMKQKKGDSKTVDFYNHNGWTKFESIYKSNTNDKTKEIFVISTSLGLEYSLTFNKSHKLININLKRCDYYDHADNYHETELPINDYILKIYSRNPQGIIDFLQLIDRPKEQQGAFSKLHPDVLKLVGSMLSPNTNYTSKGGKRNRKNKKRTIKKYKK